MKNLFVTFLSVALFSCLNVKAQNDPFELQMTVYKSALKYYDLQTATTALYTALALKPDRKDLRDSLALIYFAAEKYGQANALAEDLLKENPKRNDLLEMAAVSKQSLGLVKESLANYEALHAVDKNPFYLYQIATLQYQLKRYGECVASLDQIIADDQATKQNVTIRSQNGQGQNVPMKAAALNVKGIVALELNQDEVAKDNFAKAIELFPDFSLAKGNLNMLAQKTAKTTTTAPAKPVQKVAGK
jgi:tetratricopeptide (TPR) repeat protein